MSGKLKILFLCTGNSCRSQMAEGWTKALKGNLIDAYSAGVEPHGMNELAVRIMHEAGVDIHSHRSKHLDELKNIPFDYVVTVCDNAKESCPVFPGHSNRIHKGFEDPAALQGTEEERLSLFRRVRDGIRSYLKVLL